jgi:flagellar biosynthetic protein FlhB
MGTQDKAEKTIKATPRRRQKAKEEGDLPRAREFPNIMGLIAGVVVFFLFGGAGIAAIARLVRKLLLQAGTTAVTPESVQNLFWETSGQVALIVGPLFITLLIVAILFSMLFQGGWNISAKAFMFRPDRFNPVTGLKRIMGSANALANLLKTMLIVFIVAYITWDTIVEEMPNLPGLMMAPVPVIINYMAGFIYRCLFKIMLLLIIVGISDIAWSHYQYEERLKMSRMDLKEEIKMTEGNPQIKRRIRSIQLQMARRRMMAAVPKADVVITNPTHYAVALAYDTEKYAPEVLAKGRDYLARRIIEIAEEYNVTLVHNPALAQTIYRVCEVGDLIPPDLYKAVAEVLAYVYKLRNRLPGGVGETAAH